MTLAVDDLVASKGRIKTIQSGSRRYIEFGQAKVVKVDDAGITVTPVGKKAVLLCRPEDLEPAQLHDFDPSADVEPGTVVTVKKAAKPEGTIAVRGETAKPKPKTLKEKREAEEPKPKPRPRRRRDR